MDPFAAPAGQPDGDPFAAPSAILSEFPKLANLKGRLLMIRPVKFEERIPSKFRNPDGTVQLQDRMTADVYVIDGGEIPGFGGSDFPGMYISNDRLAKQIVPKLGTGLMALGRLSLLKPDQDPGAGNPWGLLDPTEEDKQKARAYIAAGNRQPGEPAFGSAPQQQAPAPQPAPVQQAPAPQGWGAPPAQQPAPAANPWGQQPAPAPQPVPAQQGGWGQPVAPAPGANPFGPR